MPAAGGLPRNVRITQHGVRTGTPILLGIIFLLLAIAILLFSFQSVRGDESQLRSGVFGAGAALPVAACLLIYPAARAGLAGSLSATTMRRTRSWLRLLGACCLAYALFALVTLLMTTAEQPGTSNLPAVPALALGISGGSCYGLASYLHRIDRVLSSPGL
jgi:hypothetical protein